MIWTQREEFNEFSLKFRNHQSHYFFFNFVLLKERERDTVQHKYVHQNQNQNRLGINQRRLCVCVSYNIFLFVKNYRMSNLKLLIKKEIITQKWAQKCWIFFYRFLLHFFFSVVDIIICYYMRAGRVRTTVDFPQQL